MASYCSSLVVSEGAQRSLTPDGKMNFDTLPDAADNDEDWDLDGAIGRNSAQVFAVKRRIQDLQD